MGHGAARCKNAAAAAPAEAEAEAEATGDFGGETTAPAVPAEGGWGGGGEEVAASSGW